ncbi:MAG: hypothetical protein IJU30_07340, partial [Lachnospiraceae bacterium]|nr:hypothetical protein [Lachnospiraceae bacterium]
IDAPGYDDEYYWFWFNSSGEKYDNPNKTKKINGKSYAFDGFGAMQYEWYEGATITETSSLGWYNSADDGHLAKSEWIWADESDVLGIDDGDDHWFYADKHGELVTNDTKKINGKWYSFDDYGRMQWGLVWLAEESVKAENNAVVRSEDPEDISADDVYAQTEGYLHFFSNDEEKDGSMKTGASIKIEMYDDTYTFGFDKTSGAALHGVEKNKLYKNGILQTASDNRYDYAKVDGKYYLVSSNGTRVKLTSRTYKDADDYYWFVAEGDDETGYTLYKATTAADAKAKKGEEFK